jgi:hypothetical protein
MKADDPRLKRAHDEVIEAVNKLHDLIVTVLKYHVHVEIMMVELIEAHGEMAKETFAEKIKQCEHLNPPEIDAVTWTLLRKANRLRNAVAHKIDGPEVKERLQQTRDAYAALSKQAAEDAKVYTDVQLALMAFTHCSSFIIVATENKKEANKKSLSLMPAPGASARLPMPSRFAPPGNFPKLTAQAAPSGAGTPWTSPT